MKLFIILAVHIALAYGTLTLNEHLKKCPRNDPSTPKCIVKSVELLRPDLVKGIPEVNFPRLEPFRMKYLELNAEVPGLLLRGEASNIVAKGASNFKIKSVKIDFENYVLETNIVIPRLDIKADYTTHGSKLYLAGISGSGQFKATFTNVNAAVRTSGHPIFKNGKEFVKIDDVIANIKFGSASLASVPDNPTYKAKLAASMIKKHSKDIIKLLGPVINKAAGPIIMKYTSKVTNTVPLSDLFSS